MIDDSIWFEHDILKRVVNVWKRSHQKAYLVGGAVRDGLLGRLTPNADLDLLVSHNALNISRRLADTLDAAFYPVDADRGVGRVVFDDHRHLDVADFRAESLEGDLRDRDFTINAIALALNCDHPKLIDPTNGQADLRAEIIRVASEVAIKTDPIRAVRGVRLAQTLGFEIDGKTAVLISDIGEALRQTSPERMRDELQKLLGAPQPGSAIGMLQDYGLLKTILPETQPMLNVKQSPPHHLSVWEHTIKVMNNRAQLLIGELPEIAEFQPQLAEYFQLELPGMLSCGALMPWIGLLHDSGKPHTKSVDESGRIRFFGHEKVSATLATELLRRFKFSERAVKFVTTVVQHHMHPLLLANEPTVTARAVHRFLVATGDAAPAVTIFSLLDHQATYMEGDEAGLRRWHTLLAVAHRLLSGYFSPKPKVLLSGIDVISALKIDPGPKVGSVLRQLAEAQAVGEISTKAEALKFLKTQRQ